MENVKHKYIRKTCIVAIAVFVLGGFLIKSDSFVINWAMAITNPLVKMGDNLYMSVKSVFTMKDIVSENITLTKNNIKLISENVLLKEAEKENDALKKQLGISAEMGRKTLRADICGFDPLNFESLLTVNKGLKDGIQKGMPVVSEEGALIGKIDDVADGFSKVLLIFSSRSSVAAITQSSRISGIVKGNFGTSLSLDMIPQFEELEIDEMIITSGIGGIFPRAIPIGSVAEVKTLANEVFKKAEIEPLIKLRQIESVVIIL